MATRFQAETCPPWRSEEWNHRDDGGAGSPLAVDRYRRGARSRSAGGLAEWAKRYPAFAEAPFLSKVVAAAGVPAPAQAAREGQGRDGRRSWRRQPTSATRLCKPSSSNTLHTSCGWLPRLGHQATLRALVSTRSWPSRSGTRRGGTRCGYTSGDLLEGPSIAMVVDQVVRQLGEAETSSVSDAQVGAATRPLNCSSG